MVATSLHFVALEGQTRWPLESCQLTVVVFAPSSIASLARVEHTMQVLFVVLRDEGRRHLLKAVPKHFRSGMRLASAVGASVGSAVTSAADCTAGLQVSA